MFNRSDSYDNFTREVERRREESRQRLCNCRLAIMLWGEKTTSNNPLSQIRLTLKDKLEANGHYVMLGEDVCDLASDYTLVGQMAAQAGAFDLIFSIPTSIGSLSEVHTFFAVPAVSSKLIVYMNDKWENEGFSGLSLLRLQSKVTAAVKTYNEKTIEEDIINSVLREVYKLQEAFILFSKSE